MTLMRRRAPDIRLNSACLPIPAKALIAVDLADHQPGQLSDLARLLARQAARVQFNKCVADLALVARDYPA